MAPTSGYTSIEICSGAGGQALGIERAGFRHLVLVENDPACCNTLRAVRAGKFGVRTAWKPVVQEINVKRFYAGDLEENVDLYAAGVPCPPFSRAGRQLGAADERDLFPIAIRHIKECRPRAVMLENVPGLLHGRFDAYRREVIEKPLEAEGYICFPWKLIAAKDFGVPQVRSRAIFVAMRPEEAEHFEFPDTTECPEPPTVGEALRAEMARGGWEGANEWARKANGIAPTLVGGSKKHGGPDLGPTQARKQWEKLHVNGKLVAEDPPGPDWNGAPPMLTVRMAAILQGFPADWPFWGSKTAAYRQVGNAFPPPVAEAVARKIASALRAVDGTGQPVSATVSQDP